MFFVIALLAGCGKSEILEVENNTIELIESPVGFFTLIGEIKTDGTITTNLTGINDFGNRYWNFRIEENDRLVFEATERMEFKSDIILLSDKGRVSTSTLEDDNLEFNMTELFRTSWEAGNATILFSFGVELN